MDYIKMFLNSSSLTTQKLCDNLSSNINFKKNSPPSKLLFSFGKKGSKEGCFSMPCGIAVTEKGDIIVADTENHRLQIFSPDGTYKNSISEKGCRPHQLHHPACVALTLHNCQHIVVTDSVNAAIKVFRQDGSFVAQYVECGDYPYGLAITEDNYIIVTDLHDHSVVILSPQGDRHNQFGQFGNGSHDFDHPYFVACDIHNNILVSDFGNSSIKIFSFNGSLLQLFSINDFRLFKDEFVLLQGLTIDSRGNILIIGNGSVYICARNGRLWEVITPSDGLNNPKTIAFSSPDKLIIVQEDNTVVAFQYNMDDFKSLQLCPLSYKRKRGTSEQSINSMMSSMTQSGKSKCLSEDTDVMSLG